jgi:hypothetical protein
VKHLTDKPVFALCYFEYEREKRVEADLGRSTREEEGLDLSDALEELILVALVGDVIKEDKRSIVKCLPLAFEVTLLT